MVGRVTLVVFTLPRARGGDSKASDSPSDAAASGPLASTGVDASGALALFAALVLAAGAGLALVSHRRA